MIKDVTLCIEGLDCEDEARIIRAKMEGLKGIVSFEINIMGRSLKVSYDESHIAEADIIRAIAGTGMKARVEKAVVATGRPPSRGFMTTSTGPRTSLPVRS